MIVLALTLALQAPPPPKAVRAEQCLAHINALIVEAATATGRVAGPSWFIRDWWSARLPKAGLPGALTVVQRDELVTSMMERAVTDPERRAAELGSCVDEAIDGGALPGGR